jgi:hypothetical protein
MAAYRLSRISSLVRYLQKHLQQVNIAARTAALSTSLVAEQEHQKRGSEMSAMRLGASLARWQAGRHKRLMRVCMQVLSLFSPRTP